MTGFGEALVVESCIGARWASGWLSGSTSAFLNMIELVGGEIIRALSEPLVVGRDPKHQRPNCWIVSLFGQRPHFFGSQAPVHWGLEEIIRVGGSLASQNGLPHFPRESLYHALFGAATRQTLTRRANPREAFTAPREPPPALGSRRNNPRLESASP